MSKQEKVSMWVATAVVLFGLLAIYFVSRPVFGFNQPQLQNAPNFVQQTIAGTKLQPASGGLQGSVGVPPTP